VRGYLASYFTNYSGFRPDFLQIPKKVKLKINEGTQNMTRPGHIQQQLQNLFKFKEAPLRLVHFLIALDANFTEQFASLSFLISFLGTIK